MWIWCKYGVKNGVTRALKLQFFARFCRFLQRRSICAQNEGKKMVPREGIEPTTHCLEGSCSIL